MVKEELTNERINKRFPNPFILVNHAIAMAKKMIQVESQGDENPVNRVLEMIDANEEIEEFLEPEIRNDDVE